MKYKNYIYILFILKIIFNICLSQSCKYYGSGGESVDFSSAPSYSFQGTTSTGSDYTLYFNLCRSTITCSSNLFACQIFPGSTYAIGTSSSFSYSLINGGISLSYSAPTPQDCTRTLKVDILCLASEEFKKITSYENPTCSFYAQYYSKYACKNCAHLNNCNSLGSCSANTGACTCIDQATGNDCSQSRLSITTVSSTTINGGLVYINGYFGTTSSSIQVKIGDEICSNPIATSSQITCTIPSGEGTKDVIVSDRGLSATKSNGFTYQYFDCDSSCNPIHSTCNSYQNVCECDDQSFGDTCSNSRLIIDNVITPTVKGGEAIINGYFGTTSSLQVLINDVICSITEYSNVSITCLANPGQGVNNITVIDRDLNYTLEGGFIYQNLTCTPACNVNHGKCDGYEGICNCDTQTEGDQCEKSKLSISSSSITNKQGGTVFISGYFGNITNQFNITIGNLKCENIHLFNYTTLSCEIGPGSGFKDIIIMDNDLLVVGKDRFKYQSNESSSCINNCSNNGECFINGTCGCFGSYTGFDCGSRLDNQIIPIPKINETTGESSISNGNLLFKLNIISLVEYSIDNSIVKEHPLNNISNIKSTILNKDENKKVLFSQFISDVNCTVEYIVEEVVNQKKQFEFADIGFTVEAGSLKITALINNYQFMNSLNTLQLRLKSNVLDDQQQQQQQKQPCNNKEYNVNSDQLNSESNINYITISKDSNNILSRFINRVISDGRITPIKTTIVSTSNNTQNDQFIIIGINIPHCSSSCILDPSFSLVLSNDFKHECDNDSNITTILSISIVLPCVGVTGLMIAGAILYKKYYLGITLFSNKIRLNSISRYSRKRLFL